MFQRYACPRSENNTLCPWIYASLYVYFSDLNGQHTMLSLKAWIGERENIYSIVLYFTPSCKKLVPLNNMYYHNWWYHCCTKMTMVYKKNTVTKVSQRRLNKHIWIFHLHTDCFILATMISSEYVKDQSRVAKAVSSHALTTCVKSGIRLFGCSIMYIWAEPRAIAIRSHYLKCCDVNCGDMYRFSYAILSILKKSKLMVKHYRVALQ